MNMDQDPLGQPSPPLKKSNPTPDILEMLVEALVLRIKDRLMEEITEKISNNLPEVEADAVEGLDDYIIRAIDYERHVGGRKIDVDDIEGLDKAIEDVIKNASVSLDFSF